MLKGLAVAGVLLLAAGCGSSGAATPAKTVTVTPSASISWDDQGTSACQSSRDGAYLAARMSAELSTIRDLQDAALREDQTGATTLVKAWCQQHYHG
jgi:hypothetical protein